MLMRTRHATDHYAIRNDIFDDKPSKHRTVGAINQNYDRDFSYSDVDTKRSGVGNNRAEQSTKSEGIYIFRKV